MEDNIKFIKNQTPRREILETIAEEASELAQAALKVIRAEKLSKNPTPTDAETAYKNFITEVQDVLVCINVLGFDFPTKEELNNHPRVIRWANRIKESEK